MLTGVTPVKDRSPAVMPGSAVGVNVGSIVAFAAAISYVMRMAAFAIRAGSKSARTIKANAVTTPGIGELEKFMTGERKNVFRSNFLAGMFGSMTLSHAKDKSR